jgi:hypothetical protein
MLAAIPETRIGGISVRHPDIQISIAREAGLNMVVQIMVRGGVQGSQVQNRTVDISIRTMDSPGGVTTRPACF